MLAKLSLHFLFHLRNNSTVTWKLKHKTDSVKYLGIQIDASLAWKQANAFT